MPMFSTPQHYLKAISLEQPLGVGKTSRTYVPRTEERVKSLKVFTGQSTVVFFFFLRFCLFMGDTGRGRSRLPARSLMQDLIPGPWDHDLSQRHSTTEPPRCPQACLFDDIHQHSTPGNWFLQSCVPPLPERVVMKGFH